MTPINACDTPNTGAKDLSPFYGRVEDVFMVDKTQAQLFASLGRHAGLFRGLARWPHLEQAFAVRSREWFHEMGAEKWEAAGGIHGPDGVWTCQPMSHLAAKAVREIAAGPGGLFWMDDSGVVWAVRLNSSQPNAERYAAML